MAIHQTKKQSDLEKRLRLLRQQIYGKGEKWEVRNGKMENEVRSEKSHISPPTSDIPYLYHDLTKISILASIALGAQLIIFFLMKNNNLPMAEQILNFNF